MTPIKEDQEFKEAKWEEVKPHSAIRANQVRETLIIEEEARSVDPKINLVEPKEAIIIVNSEDSRIEEPLMIPAMTKADMEE